MCRYLTPLLPRTVGFCYALKHEVDDLEEAWGFAKKDPNESDDEEDEASQEATLEFKELTADELGKANTALQAHMMIVAEIRKKIEQELFMAEAAATGGWAAVSILENKTFTNITGASAAEKELKMQRIRKAVEMVKKEQTLNNNSGTLKMRIEKKLRKRPGQFKQFASKFYGLPYDGYNDMATPVYGHGRRGGYEQGYGGDGGQGWQFGGYGYGGVATAVSSYGNRGAGGSRGGGGRPARTCHRCVPR